MRRILLFVLIGLALLGWQGCVDEGYSTNPNDRLSFSVDTLSFDTVFATVPSATMWLKVYNRNSKPLLIDQIALEATQGIFRLNVDGVSGGEKNRFTEVEVLARDSVIIFVEIRSEALNQLYANPALLRDKLLFELNGQRQQVVLEASVWDAVVWKGKRIDRDTTLTVERGMPFLIYDSLYIAEGKTLTIQPGCRFFFHDKAYVKAEGRILAKGTSQNPIYFRGDRLDNLLSGFPYDRMPGQWSGIWLKGKSYENEFSHVVVRAATYSMVLDSSDVKRRKLTMINCQLQNASSQVFTAFHCQTSLHGCEFSNGGASTVALVGGDHELLQSTIVNYGAWGSSGARALTLSNRVIKEDNRVVGYPLQARIYNTIVHGKQSDELSLLAGTAEQGVDAPMEFRFTNCLIKGKALGEPYLTSFDNVLWSQSGKNDPKFVATGKEYIFDFRLNEGSAAIAKGDKEQGDRIPVDFYGNNRTSAPMPDLGAYQYVPSPKKIERR